MTALKHKDNAASTGSAAPMDRLADLLKPEMKAANAVIIDRMRSHIPLVEQLAAYLIAAGGKRIRPLLTLAAAKATQPDAKAEGLAAAVEFIHTATLMHDDVVDESALRRGKPAANVVFGNKASVLVGDFLFARAFELMVECNDLRILDILASASRVIAEGEVLQMSLTGDIAITLKQYEDIIEAKTAALFAAACEAGARAGKADETTAKAWRAYGHHLGMAFQMADDLLDYANDKSQTGKDAGDDFREGKLTLPVILALAEADATERDFWSRTMKDQDQTPDDFATACAIIEKHGTITKGRTLAQAHAEKARAALKTLPESEIAGVLDDLLDFVVARNH